MATIKQIQANRLNASKSTGPRSAEGKAASCMNALKSGIDAQSQIIPGENAAGLEALTAEYMERFEPATPEERFCVDTLVRDEWQLRRYARADAQLWKYAFDHAYQLDQDNPLAQSFTIKQETFLRLQRRIDAAERSYHRALRELQSLRQARLAETPAAQPEPAPPKPPQPIAKPTPSPEIGFVPPSARHALPNLPRRHLLPFGSQNDQNLREPTALHPNPLSVNHSINT